MKYDIIRAILLIAIFIILLSPYSKLIFSLQLFGDAAHHAYIAKNIEKTDVLKYITYPPTYAALSRTWFELWGEQGLKFNVIIGLALLFFGMYFLTKELTNNRVAGAFAAILVLGSPKILFYSARMYIEIFLSGVIVFAILFMARYLRTRAIGDLIFLSLFTGLAAALKQQGLFLLLPAVFVTIFYAAFRKNRQHILTFILIVTSVIIIPYGVQYHYTGTGLYVLKHFPVLNAIDDFLANAAGYKPQVVNETLQDELEKIKIQNVMAGNQQAERRHITPLEPFLSQKDFMNVHSAYHDFWQTRVQPWLIIGFQIALIIGLFLTLTNIITKNKLLELNARLPLLLFFILFLVLNYIAFILNTDQTRYHLFVSIIMIFFVAQILNLDKTKRKLFSLFFVMFVALTVLVGAYADNGLNKRWKYSQLYAPSRGGIKSIEETGRWIARNVQPYENIWTTCPTELVYYSNREIKGGWAIVFLNSNDLDHYFSKNKIKYAVVLKSQISRGTWANYCYLPGEFYNRIRKTYPIVYRSSKEDVYVFEVSGKIPNPDALNRALGLAVVEFIEQKQTEQE